MGLLDFILPWRQSKEVDTSPPHKAPPATPRPALTRGIKLTGVNNDGQPEYSIDFNIRFDPTPLQTDEPAPYIRDVFGPLPDRITPDQTDILHSTRNYAALMASTILLRTPNRIKKAFHAPFAALLLNDPDLLAKVREWDRKNFNENRDKKLTDMPDAFRVYISATALAQMAADAGAPVKWEEWNAIKTAEQEP